MNKDNKNNLAQVFHFDLYGKRQAKYDFLNENSLQSIEWTKIEFSETDENYFFVPKDFALKDEYDKGFKVDELFPVNTSGVKTHDDANLVSFEKFDEYNQKYDYRPFDTRNICYDLSRVVRARFSVMKHFIGKENIGFCLMRSLINTKDFSTVLLSQNIMDINYYGFQTYLFPLYLYPGNDGLQLNKGINPLAFETERIPNLDKQIFAEIEKRLGVAIEPIELLDYIYAVLHSPSYRERYKEFLKIDFPRVSFPENAEKFHKLVEFGGKLRRLHLLEDIKIPAGMAEYNISGSNEVEKTTFFRHCASCPQSPEYNTENGRVYINEKQYFTSIPETAWNFYIGGYQPAQKWLKDRKGRKLNFEDVQHYRTIIVALTETDCLMKNIDKVLI